ncbi:MAG: DUF4127 family protein [Clostridiales bacterium]
MKMSKKYCICLLVVLSVFIHTFSGYAYSKCGRYLNENTIINVPIDIRPVSNEYMENLVDLGGDNMISVDRKYLDKGPSSPDVNDWVKGDSINLRCDLIEKLKYNNNKNTTVIINSSAYIFNGLVYSRIPDSYLENNIENALKDLDKITKRYKKPRYYFHVMMPRVIPETRGFDYKTSHVDYGLEYYYLKLKDGIIDETKKSKFTDLLIEYGYVKSKKDMGKKLEIWESEFLNNFNYNYIKCASDDFIYKGIPIANLYEKIYSDTCYLMKKMIKKVRYACIDELVISMDDYLIPTFIKNKKDEDWVDKDEYSNPVKYSFGRRYLDEVILMQEDIFGKDSVEDSIQGRNKKINYIFGTDEVPQMIYSRDLTRRKHFATKLEVNYTLDKDQESSKKHVGAYDALSTEKLISQRINFVTRKLKKGYENRIEEKNDARNFMLFVHNSDLKDENGKNYLYNEEESINFAREVYREYNKGSNIGVLDLMTNRVDWGLLEKLSEYKENSINQLACYSGFNTIGNSTGLGIAHAQVFGTADYLYGNSNNKNIIAKAHSKVLIQHLLEDGIYNTKLRYVAPGTYSYIKNNINVVFNNTTKYDTNNKPGGRFWIVNKFMENSLRINNELYKWDKISVEGDLPTNRVFECIVKSEIQ